MGRREYDRFGPDLLEEEPGEGRPGPLSRLIALPVVLLLAAEAREP